MKRVMLVAGCVGFMLVLGCVSTGETDPEQPVLNETTLTRFDGSTISLEELESIRFSAVATADTIAHIERELREPWAEHRNPSEVLSAVSESHPRESRLAGHLWEAAEPKGRGQDRVLFNEFGFYRNELLPDSFTAGIHPESLEGYIGLLLREHSDATPGQRLLAAWRRLSPRVVARKDHYVASHWRFAMDYVSPVEVAVSDSLLGPHNRSQVVDAAGASFPGPTDSFEGYTAPALMLDLLAPGGDSPVLTTIEALSAIADGTPAAMPILVAPGATHSDDVDPAFLRAVLHGLLEGTCELESLPGGTRELTVTFSYLLEDAEARATLRFERIERDWRLSLFDYEPAAASLLDTDARLDLMPMVRDLVGGAGN